MPMNATSVAGHFNWEPFGFRSIIMLIPTEIKDQFAWTVICMSENVQATSNSCLYQRILRETWGVSQKYNQNFIIEVFCLSFILSKIMNRISCALLCMCGAVYCEDFRIPDRLSPIWRFETLSRIQSFCPSWNAFFHQTKKIRTIC